MAYAIKYLFKFESSNGTTREIRVLQDGYTGEVIQRPLGRAPILKKQQNGPVHGTSLEFYAECHVDREFIEFYTSDPKAYRVDLYAGATLLWQGYITPELYSEPDIAPPYDVQVVATDGVGELKLYDYAAQGTVTLRTLLSGLLSHTGLGTDIYLISSLKAGSRGAGALLDMTINLDYMEGESCYDVLTYLLDTLHATITWWKGAWILTRETNVTFTSGKVRYFNTAGNSALLADSVQTLGSLRTNPAWPVGQLSTVIDPAKNRVTVQAPWHVVTCLQNPDMTSDASWAKSNNASYGPDGYLFPNNDEGTSTYATAYISQALAMEGLRVPMSFELRATGVSAQVGVRVGAVIGVLLTYTVGNVVYHLRKGSEGTPEWTPGPAIGTSIDGSLVDYQRPLASFDMDRIQAETLQITEIPAFVQGTSYPSGTLTVYILGTCARVYAATLDVVLPKGYQDILRIDNGARGEGSEVEIAIGRETTDNAYYAAFLQGLLLDSGNLITSFSDANFPGGMDYLSFIARDYALSVALPRAKVTGTVYLESGIAAPPLVFTKGALNYWLQTWSWNLYEDELEIEGLTLPSASLTVESETILESTAGASSSSGRTSGGGGGSIAPGVSMAAVQEWVNGQGFATQSWVTDKGYLTGITEDMIADALGYTPLAPDDLLGYATQSWVTSQGYITGITATDIETALDYIPVSPTDLTTALGGYLPLTAGTAKPLTGDLYIITGDTDKCIQFSYDTRHLAGAAWRIISEGTGSGDTNYLSFQTGGSSASATTWETVLRMTMDTRRVGINTTPSYQLDVNGPTRVTSLRIGTTTNAAASLLEWDETNRAWKLTGNFYATGWVSAGGVSSGGGASGIDLAAMWASLTNSISDAYAATKIAAAHIPDMSGTYGYLKSGDVSGVYLPLNVGAGKTITSTSNAPLNINSTTTSNEVGFRYQLSGENKAFFGYNASSAYGTYMYSYAGPYYLGITDAGVAHYNGNALLHAGNYTTYVNTTNFPGLYKTGTVTSVAMTVPTGLSVSGSPITTSGTLAISFASGYSIPTTAKQSNWDTAYGWGNHASAGYLLASTAASTYLPLNVGAGKTITSTASVPLTIDTTASGNYINFKVGGGLVAQIGYSQNSGAFLQCGSNWVNIDNSGVFTRNNSDVFYHSGNSNTLSVNWTAREFTAAADYGIKTYGSSYSMIFQSPSDFTTYVGQPDTPTFIRSNGNPLYHRRGSTDYVVWDAANSNLTSVNWAVNNLSLNANINPTAKDTSNLGAANLNFNFVYANQIYPGTGNNLWLNSSGSIYFVNGTSSTGTTLGAWSTTGLGIGVSNAAYRLHVSGTAFFNIPSFTGFAIKRSTSSGSSGITFISADSSNFWNIGCDPAGGYAERFYWYFNNSYLAYMSTTGNLVATGAITAGAASDARLKTNIRALSADAAKRIVMGLNPVTFTWNAEATKLYNRYKGDDLGMIAQEVEPYLPQAIGTIFESYKRLDYDKVVTPLVKVAQDHETRLAQAERRIAVLERENTELKRKLFAC